MIGVLFFWDPLLISLRRDVCPNAKWDKPRKQWLMAPEDAERFRDAAHRLLDGTRRHAVLQIGDEQWMIGFRQGAPFKIGKAP
jgi:hypothetical protein